MKNWWSQRPEREQQMLTVGGIAVAIFILYAMIWMPIQTHLATMRVSIGKDQKTLQWMESVDKEINKMQSQTNQQRKSVTPVELLSIVQSTAQDAELSSALTQSKQASGDSIQLHFQKADFDRLMAMLIILLKEQNITVTQFTATAANAPGVVNADVTLKIS